VADAGRERSQCRSNAIVKRRFRCNPAMTMRIDPAGERRLVTNVRDSLLTATNAASKASGKVIDGTIEMRPI